MRVEVEGRSRLIETTPERLAALALSEKVARERAERAAARALRLSAFTAAMMAARTMAEVAEAAVGEGVSAFGAQQGAFGVVLPSRELALLAGYGVTWRPVERMSLRAAYPICEVALSGQPAWLEGQDEIAARWPGLVGRLGQPAGAVMVLPLSVGAAPIGAVAFAFREERSFEAEERAFALTLAGVCAQALERARLHEAERKARAEAERLAERMARLQEIAGELTRALDVDQVALVALEGALKTLGARLGGIYLVDPNEPLDPQGGDGPYATLTHHVGPAEAFHLLQRLPLGRGYPMGDTLFTGEPVFLESWEELRARYPEVAGRMRLAGLGPLLALASLPLTVEGRTMGALSLAFAETFTFRPEDQQFLLLLARHAAQALERARLHAEEKRARAQLDERNQALQAIIRSSPTAIVLLDLDGVVRLWNAAAERMFGWSADEVLGRPLPTVPPERRHELRENLHAVARGQSLAVQATTRRRKDGSPVEIAAWLAPVASAAGATQCLAVMVDVTDQTRAAAALRDSEARYRRLFEANMVGVGCWDADGLITDANDALLGLLGYSRADLEAGRISWRAITSAESMAIDARATEQIAAHGVAPTYEKTYRRKDGTLVPALVGAAAWEGRTDSGVLLALDITDRKRSEQAQRFLADAGRVLAGSLDPDRTVEALVGLAVPARADWCVVELTDADGQLLQQAVRHRHAEHEERLRQLRRLRPCPLDTLLGLPPVRHTGRPHLCAEVNNADLDAVASGPEELALLRAVGIRSLLTVPLTAFGRVIGLMQFALACSSRRYDALDVQLAEELARRAGLAIENARLYREAKEAIRKREEFLSIASHELKTPLTSVQLQLESLGRLLRRAELPSRERLVRFHDVLSRQVERQTRLVSALLDSSRLAEGRLELDPEPFDLCALVRDVAERFGAELGRAGSTLELRLSGRAEGRWDRTRVDQIVTNLVSNAVKYGAGRPIELGVQVEPDQVRLTVRDEGPGIPAEHHERIFERFERAVSERNYGGFGLGLWISRQLAEAMHGRLRVDSAAGEGAVFTLALPR